MTNVEEENKWQVFGTTFGEIRQRHQQVAAEAYEKIRQTWNGFKSPPNPTELTFSDHHHHNTASREAIVAEALKPLRAQEVTAEDIESWEKNGRPAEAQYRVLESALIYHNPHISNPAAESDHFEKAYREKGGGFGSMLEKYRGSLTQKELAELVNHCPYYDLAPGEKDRLMNEGIAFLGEIEEGKVGPSRDMAQLLSHGLVRHLERHAEWITVDEKKKLDNALQQLERQYDTRLDESNNPGDSTQHKLGYSTLSKKSQRNNTGDSQTQYDELIARLNHEQEEGQLWRQFRKEYRRNRIDDEEAWIEREMQRRREGGLVTHNVAEIKEKLQVLFIVNPKYGLNVPEIARESKRARTGIYNFFDPKLRPDHLNLWVKLAAHLQPKGKLLDDFIHITIEYNKAFKTGSDTNYIKQKLVQVFERTEEQKLQCKPLARKMHVGAAALGKILNPEIAEDHFEFLPDLADYLERHGKSAREFVSLIIELDKILQTEKKARKGERPILS